MKLRVLLINPWIYDFAAANVWSRPLGLLRVAEFLSAHNVELALVDCMEAGRTKRYGIGSFPKETVEKPECLRAVPRKFGRYGIKEKAFTEALLLQGRPDLVLVTSIMSYWYPGVQRTVEIVRKTYGGVPVILGGMYATLWSGHALETSGADCVYKGPVGEELRFFLQTFGFRIKRRSVERPYHSLGLYSRYPFAPVLTGTGCPYDCAYCASGLISGRPHRRRPAGDVLAEIIELNKKGIQDFAFYDDALLADADMHVKILLKEVIRQGLDVRFHCPNGLHARFVDDELAYLMRRAGFATLRMGLETTDGERQSVTGGKVTSEEISRAVALLKKRGFSKNELGIYLMLGLPGQAFDEVKEGVSFLKSLGARIHLTEFSPIPGTRSWDELRSRGIITDSIDPLLTNNTVFSYLFSGYDRAELEKLRLEVKGYNLAAE
jgi:radical SAM superfamily enzyme YgiQ (UPF0313 family)